VRETAIADCHRPAIRRLRFHTLFLPGHRLTLRSSRASDRHRGTRPQGAPLSARGLDATFGGCRAEQPPMPSRPMRAESMTSSLAYSACLSSARRMPRPNSALSRRASGPAGPRPPVTVQGVVGWLPR